MNISIILPAYREAENLENILPKLHAVLIPTHLIYEILVVDTLEKMDNTQEVCLKNNATYLNRVGGNAYGDAIRTGFRHAKGTYLVVMDADGSHDPSDIVRFYEKIQSGEYDLVIGSRYCKGGYTDNNFILRFMSWVLNITYRILFGLKVKDVSDSFRMYKTAQLQSMDFECDNFDIVEEILIKLNLLIDKLSVVEIPISFSKRFAGESKRDLKKFILSYLKTINKLMRIKNKVEKEKIMITQNAHHQHKTRIEACLTVAIICVGKIFRVKLSDNAVNTVIQFIKFGIVGVSNTLVNYLVYAVMLVCLRSAGILINIDYLIAQIVAFILSVLWAFYWNQRVVFAARYNSKCELLRMLVKTYIAYSFTGLFLNSLLLVFWISVLHISEFIAPIINILINVPLNFVISKFWAFNEK